MKRAGKPLFYVFVVGITDEAAEGFGNEAPSRGHNRLRKSARPIAPAPFQFIINQVEGKPLNKPKDMVEVGK